MRNCRRRDARGAGERAIAGGAVSRRLGHPDAGAGSAALQPDVVSQRLGLAARHCALRGRRDDANGTDDANDVDDNDVNDADDRALSAAEGTSAEKAALDAVGGGTYRRRRQRRPRRGL